MSAAPARLVMVLAARSLGSDRWAWAQAMIGEYEVAEEDGRPLSFALGCLWGALRMMPAHAEGRFMLTSYALSLGMLVPIAAMLGMAAWFGFPFVDASDGIGGYLSGTGAHVLLLNAGSLTIAPALTLLMLLLAAFHLPLAWWTLDRDWQRVAAASRFGAAILTTLTIVTSCVALDPMRLLLPMALLAGELAIIAGLVRWHAQLFERDAFEALDPAT